MMLFDKQKSKATVSNISIYIFKHKWSLLEYIFIFTLLCFRFWLAKDQMLTVIGNAIYDDRLYINHAHSIINGQWLGLYDSRTLIKGVIYPLWIAGAYFMRLPLLYSQQILYCFAACLLYFVLRKSYGMKFALFVFGVILFDPVFYQPSERIIRYHITSSFSLLIVVLLFSMINRRNMFRSIFYAMLGIILAVFALTREEFYWILPFVFGMLSYFGIIAYKTNIRIFVLMLKNYAIAFCCFLVVMFSIGYINFHTYGVFVINELTYPAFSVLYGDLLRVKHITNERYIVITKEVVQSIATVSATFSWLLPTISLPENSLVTSEYLGYQTNEISGAHFVFVLREAAESLGYFKNANKSLDFFKGLHDEISTLCETNRLSCDPINTRYFTELTGDDIYTTGMEILSSLQQVLFLSELNTHVYSSSATESDVLLFQNITHAKKLTKRANVIMTDQYDQYSKQKPLIQFALFLYRYIFSFVVIVGLLAFVGMMVLMKKLSRFTPTSMSLIFLIISIFILIALISYIKAVQFPLLTIQYLAPIHPLLYLISFLSIREFFGFYYKHCQKKR